MDSCVKVGTEDGKGKNILGVPKQRGEKGLFYLKAQIVVVSFFTHKSHSYLLKKIWKIENR